MTAWREAWREAWRAEVASLGRLSWPIDSMGAQEMSESLNSEDLDVSLLTIDRLVAVEEADHGAGALKDL